MRKQRWLKAPKFWNSHWCALLNRCINDTWTIFPGTKQLNLFSHNGSLHPLAWLAKLWPSTLEAPDLNPNWLGNKMPLWAAPQLPSGQGPVGASQAPGEGVGSECLAYYFSFGRRYKRVRQLYFFNLYLWNWLKQQPFYFQWPKVMPLSFLLLLSSQDWYHQFNPFLESSLYLFLDLKNIFLLLN